MSNSFLDIISKLYEDSPEKKFITFDSTHFTRKQFYLLALNTIRVLNQLLKINNDPVIYHGRNDILIPLLIVAAQQLDFKLILLPVSTAKNNVLAIFNENSAQVLLSEVTLNEKYVDKQIAPREFFKSISTYQTEMTVIPNGFNELFRLIFLTSGTTGKARLIALKKEHLLANVEGSILGQKITTKDVCLSFLTLCQSGGCCIQFLPSFFSGAEIIISKNQSTPHFLELTRLYKPSITLIVPFFLKQLIQNTQFDLVTESLKQYRFIGIGSTILDDDIIYQLSLKHIKFCNIYGLTEAGPFSFFNMVTFSEEMTSISIGKPANGINYQMTQENELLLKGPQIQPEEYSKAVLLNLLDEDGWFHTGDYFSVTEDGLYFSHRKNEMVLISGHKVLLTRIEKIILTHPEVENCLVMSSKSTFSPQVHLYVQKKLDSCLTEKSLRRFCKGHLNRHEVPRRIFFVDEIPKSSIGKNMRTAIKSTPSSSNR